MRMMKPFVLCLEALMIEWAWSRRAEGVRVAERIFSKQLRRLTLHILWCQLTPGRSRNWRKVRGRFYFCIDEDSTPVLI